MSKRKKTGVILIILQMLGFIGMMSSNYKPFDNIFSLIGFCIPGILGLYLVINDKDEPKEEKTNSKEKKKKEKIIY